MSVQQRFRAFVQWLGNNPEDGRYLFASCEDCAMAQFAKAIYGKQFLSAGTRGFSVRCGNSSMEIDLMPSDLGSNRYALHENAFGRAYQSLAIDAGLPKRATTLRFWTICLSRFFKRKHALAA